MKTKSITLLVLSLLFLFGVSLASAVDQITFRRDGKEQQISGRLLVEAQDGGLLLLERDGMLWAIPPEEQVKHTSDDSSLQAVHPRGVGEKTACRTAGRFRGLAHRALFDFLRYLENLRRVVRIAFRAALHGVHQLLEPEGLRRSRSRNFRSWRSSSPIVRRI